MEGFRGLVHLFISLFCEKVEGHVVGCLSCILLEVSHVQEKKEKKETHMTEGRSGCELESKSGGLHGKRASSGLYMN